ncbi:MAG: subfamily polymerase sigma factor [Acidobacteria bacterium]|jgi:RNA polymerase sigma factor (sigma-70 family)|nr:subfamily polymerase sigma factor [Acidobacteriota bacterium]
MGLTNSIIKPGPVRSEGKAVVLEQNAEVPSPAEPDGRADNGAGSAAAAPEQKGRPSSDEIELLYLEHRKLLLFIACRKFRVPDWDAENLIQEVFVSFMQVGTPIRDVRSWMVAAMCNASRHYWRGQGRTEALPDDIGERSDPQSHNLGEKYAKTMTVSQALGYLQPRCRETLELHYYQGHSAADVARELKTTTRYAEKLIHNCLARMREVYLKMNAVKP